MIAQTQQRLHAWLYTLHSCWTWSHHPQRWALYRNTLGALTGEWL